jgi:peptidoglycan-associated lipoprotein
MMQPARSFAPAGSLALVIAAALALSACGGKKPLPEAPVTTTRPATPATTPATPDNGAGVTTTPVTSSIMPGTVADFVAQAGSDHVLFTLDSYELDDAARTTLAAQAEWLKRYPAVKVTVEGHADERGTREYNLALGERRAQAARNFLAGRGVAVSRMTVVSYGKEKPAVDGHDEAAWAQNRRAVTLVLAP